MNRSFLQRLRWRPRWLHLPFVAIAVFLLYLLFMGDNNFLKSLRYRSEANALKREIAENADSAAFYNAKVRELITDRETLEKIAREQYGMKRPGEDVYITDLP